VACSEATTNAIEHAYGPGRADVEVVCDVEDGVVTIVVRDWGQWRPARGKDRGRGLLFMRALMDDVDVRHGDRGTQVIMSRQLAAHRPAPRGESAAAHEVPIQSPPARQPLRRRS
jgi:anti-sigma regulatory factor (Ser/Thr protein kinase)